jgi:hypothetical protein
MDGLLRRSSGRAFGRPSESELGPSESGPGHRLAVAHGEEAAPPPRASMVEKLMQGAEYGLAFQG